MDSSRPKPCRFDPNSQSFKNFVKKLAGEPIIDEKDPEKERLKNELKKALKILKDKDDLESKSQGNKKHKNEPKKTSKQLLEFFSGYGLVAPPDFHKRRARALDAWQLIKYYKFASGEKICITPNGPPIFCPTDYCLDSAWVGVYGMKSICIVTGRDMVMSRFSPFYHKPSLKQQNMETLARVAISEVECLPHKDGDHYVPHYDVAFRELCTGTVKKPFCVVSLGQGTLDEFCYEDLKLKTINYLESVVSSDLLHTHYGIIRVAIKAYQLLMWHKELRGDDIWVTIMDDATPTITRFDHLPMDIIGEQLDFVNGHSSEKDPQKPLFVRRGSVHLPDDIIGELVR